MLNQNIATIIASFIAVIGTLGGAITGVLLSNRHTSKMEHLRIEQEKLKRNTAIIEEVYTLLINIEHDIPEQINKSQIPKARKDDIDRMRTLIYLYLPSIKQKFIDLSDSIVHLGFAYVTEPETKEEKENRYEQLQHFRKYLYNLRSSLEMMVK